ncbi:MAG: response regulator transcription factor [bacterium]|nr:response regulator transcription factor [bacterium]
MTIRVLVADDHPIARVGIRKLLEMEEDIEVVGEASDGREVIEMIGQLQPDVVLLDLSMPGMDGLAALQTIQQMKGASRILVLTASEDENEWVQALKLGCSGIVVKHSPPQLIVKSIRKVRQGEIWLDSHTTAAVMHRFAMPGNEAGLGGQGRPRPLLSKREREIVALVAQGYRNREMAEKLSISQQTVKNHLHNIFGKLGVSDRLELALYAVHKGPPLCRAPGSQPAAASQADTSPGPAEV